MKRGVRVDSSKIDSRGGVMWLLNPQDESLRLDRRCNKWTSKINSDGLWSVL